MELFILIPLSLLAMLLYAVVGVVRLRRRVSQLEETMARLRSAPGTLGTQLPTESAEAGMAQPRLGTPAAPPVFAEASPLAATAATGGDLPSPSERQTDPRPPAGPVPVWEQVDEPLAEFPSADSTQSTPPEPGPARSPLAGINLEQFMGVKLFAWIGGLALFLGAAFFVKHSFEQGWVSPQLRVASGFITGLALLGGGIFLRRRQYPVTADSLCGAGVVVLYTSSYAARAYYGLLGNGAAFGLMSLITVGAFALADRLRAVPVAVLGILGGFLTPLLLSTGVDRPLALFGYIALLDLVLVAIALRRRWLYLVVLGAVGTVLLELGWASRFFAMEKLGIYLAILATFDLLFLAAFLVGYSVGRRSPSLVGPALGLPFLTLACTAWLLTFPEFGAQPGWFYSFVLLADLCILAVVVRDPDRSLAHLAGGTFIFVLLAAWTGGHLQSALLNWALAGYLGFALLHTLFPLVLGRLAPGRPPITWQAHLFPPVALILVMFPMFQNVQLSWLIWPWMLLVDVLALAVAWLTGIALVVLAVLALTVLVTAFWLLHQPAEITVLPEFLAAVGFFAAVFFTATLMLGRRLKPPGGAGDFPPWLAAANSRLDPAAWREMLPATSAVLPFLLLIMAVGRLELVNPTPVFGVALLLVAMLLGAARVLRVDALLPVALGCVLALEWVWYQNRFTIGAAGVTLGWQLVFVLAFIVYPFVFASTFAGRWLPWATAALSGPLHYYMVHGIVHQAWPNDVMGLLPAAFAVPMLAALAQVRRWVLWDEPGRLQVLAWFGGSALFFLTLIFPIQFDREWITLGWALEGTALIWLFHRVPHPGLRGLGVVLLVIAFIRLAFNPAVFEYHARSGTPILNWYLYAYGVVIACLILGARWLAPPRDHVFRLKAPPVLYGLAAVLGFLLVNIQIADGFSRGTTLTFDFTASLGQNMTYSLAWGIYGLGLLALGFRFRNAGARYGGLGLLVITLLKLFLGDLWQLGGLYRVGSLVGLAFVLIVVSMAYQRFFGNGRKSVAPVAGPTPASSVATGLGP